MNKSDARKVLMHGGSCRMMISIPSIGKRKRMIISVLLREDDRS